jgi:hypothetical protein
MSSEEELNSFAAELAALRPRSDRLDRDRLMFLAGQASVGSQKCRRTTRSRFWPAATATMTAAAAALLVMFVASPRVEIIERIVAVPTQAGGEGVRPAPDAAIQPEAIERRPATEPRRAAQPTTSRFAAALAGWLPASDGPSPRATMSYPGVRDAVLAHGLDSLPTPPSAAGGNREPDSVPSSYRSLRESLLEIEPAGSPSSNRPLRGIPFFSGAHS